MLADLTEQDIDHSAGVDRRRSCFAKIPVNYEPYHADVILLEMGLQNGQGCLDQVAFGLSITIRTKGEYI